MSENGKKHVTHCEFHSVYYAWHKIAKQSSHYGDRLACTRKEGRLAHVDLVSGEQHVQGLEIWQVSTYVLLALEYFYAENAE